jgi:hypothetical protein
MKLKISILYLMLNTNSFTKCTIYRSSIKSFGIQDFNAIFKVNLLFLVSRIIKREDNGLDGGKRTAYL